MTARTALIKTLRDGRTAVVTVKVIGYLHSASTTVTIDGEEIGSHLGPHHAAPKAALAKYPGHVAAIGPMLLTAEEAAQVEAVYREVLATIPPDWRGRREELVRAIRGAEEDLHDYLADRMDSGDYPDPFGGAEEYERRIDDAVAALRAFDAEHPEVAEQAAAQRRAAARRALEGRD